MRRVDEEYTLIYMYAYIRYAFTPFESENTRAKLNFSFALRSSLSKAKRFLLPIPGYGYRMECSKINTIPTYRAYISLYSTFWEFASIV